MSNPLVSVLMTAYNRADLVGEAIESVLSSSYKNFELLIVDDCSTDATVEIARKYEAKDARIIVHVNEKNLGDYPNRNRAASLAKGKYIKYLDSDDFMYPHCLEVMVGSMEKYPEAGFGLSAIADPLRPYPVLLSPNESYLEHFNGYGHFDRGPGSAIIKRKVFEEVGGFSGKRWVGDTELWFKIGRLFPLVKLTRDLVWDRQHVEQERKLEVSKENKEISKKMRKDLYNEMLSHETCPLTENEISGYLQRMKLKAIKNKIASWL
jgi:glycosyltransferase involved in cell wall biosynthesis